MSSSLVSIVSGPAETICNRADPTIFDRGHCTFLGHVVLVSKLGSFSFHTLPPDVPIGMD